MIKGLSKYETQSVIISKITKYFIQKKKSVPSAQCRAQYTALAWCVQVPRFNPQHSLSSRPAWSTERVKSTNPGSKCQGIVSPVGSQTSRRTVTAPYQTITKYDWAPSHFGKQVSVSLEGIAFARQDKRDVGGGASFIMPWSSEQFWVPWSWDRGVWVDADIVSTSSGMDWTLAVMFKSNWEFWEKELWAGELREMQILE